MDKISLFFLRFITLSASYWMYTACFLHVPYTSATYTGIYGINLLCDARCPTCSLCVTPTSATYTGLVLSVASTRTSLFISQFVCTGMYFPIPTWIEHCSLAYTPMFSANPSFNTLTVTFSRGILKAWVDISWSLFAFHILLDLWFLKLMHPPSILT